MDERGRLRLDAVARYLQDVAGDDVEETGWGAPQHLWVVRRTRIDVLAPFLGGGEVALATWCSGLASSVAGRRTSVHGPSGTIEVESVWIHLGHDGRPARLDDRFGVYAAAAGGRRVSTRLELADPGGGGRRLAWPLRAADVDLLGHVNNASYWQAVEEALAGTALDPALPHRAVLEYRRPLDLGDGVELDVAEDAGRVSVGFLVAGAVAAAARVEPLSAPR
jgi:acyl-ACP thioesterase